MKIIVTGGCGFIGSHVVDKLIDKGNDVVVIDDLSSGKKERLNKKATLYITNIVDAKKTNEVFKKEKPDLVVHLAAQVMLRKSIEEPILDATTNILGTINILEACKNNKVKKIIYTSTGGARYGEPKYLPVDENHPIEPSAPYGISKHTAEHYVKTYSDLYGFDYLIVCFGNVYGPRDDVASGRVTALFCDKILAGEQPIIFGDGEQTRDFIFVLDLAELISSVLEKKTEHKLFNLANGEQTSVNEIFEIIKEHSNYQGKAKHIEAIKGEVRDIMLDTSLAKKELAWKAKTTMQEGLKQTFDYFKGLEE